MSSPRSPQPRLRLKDRRRRLLWVKVAAGTGVVVLSLVLVFYAAHRPSFIISQINISGTNLVSADAVRAIVLKQLAGSYAFLVPRANAFVLPVRSIVRAVTAAFPPVASVSFSETGHTALTVSVTERQAAALWCAGVPQGEIAADGNIASSSLSVEGSANPSASSVSAQAGDCYLMDKNGFIYAKAADTSGYVAYYGTVSGGPIGATYLAGTFPAVATTVTGVGQSIRRTPQTVLVDNNATDVSVAFAEGGVLRFIEATDTQSTLQDIASVFASQSFQDHPQFEYADFRFGNKVYVKFK